MCASWRFPLDGAAAIRLRLRECLRRAASGDDFSGPPCAIGVQCPHSVAEQVEIMLPDGCTQRF